jgi:hypothetical protein
MILDDFYGILFFENFLNVFVEKSIVGIEMMSNKCIGIIIKIFIDN